MSYGIKKVRKDLLKSKKFEQLGLGFSNLDTAIIERKAIKKFEIDTILMDSRYKEKGVLKFRLELDKAYCDDSGCDTYIYDGVTDEDRKWLEDKLSELMFEFHQKIGLNPGWFKVVSMEEVNLNDYKRR